MYIGRRYLKNAGEESAHRSCNAAEADAYGCSGEPLIKLNGITVSYDGRDVLRDIDLTLCKGDFLAVSGPNGGGKTTLLRVMLRLLKPTAGNVEYLRDGKPGAKLAIGYLPQKSMIDTKFPITVHDTVRSGIMTGFFGRIPADSDQRVEETFDLCGIRGILDRTVGTLSGGQLQRTLLARAIVSCPEILVLDEPLSYVDKQFEHQIYGIMENLAKKTTIVLVSHEMSVISGMANRHIIVDHGISLCTSHHHSAKAEYNGQD